MNKLFTYIKNINKTNAVITREDVEANKYYFMLGPCVYKEEFITATLHDTNELLEKTFGGYINKKAKKEILNEVTTFLARIFRNYDYIPSDKQYKHELNHFIKSAIIYYSKKK